MLTLYLRIYGILAISHIVLQMVFGQIHHLRRRSRSSLVTLPSVAVIVPVYNEDPSLLEECLASLDRQNHPAQEVIVVDDGSPNIADLEPVYANFAGHPGWTVMRLSTNMGKRAAQRVGFEAASSSVVVTVDSDTTLDDPDALATLTRGFVRRRVGAVTGAVGVRNTKTNILTRLTALRYWMAFHQERAAQSLFGVMLCCSGPFSAYRRSVVLEVLDDYTGQRFLGKDCTFGDDRHLTNLVLSRGHQAIFDPEAHANTHVPDTWTGFLRQQVRWNKSFYRELLWSMRFAHRRNPYLAIDLTLQTVLPFMLVVAVASVVVRAVSDPMVAGVYALIVLGIAFLRCAYGALRTRSGRFLLFTAYGFIHLGLLIPTRLYAIATIWRTHWGTRGMHTARDTDVEPAHVLEARPVPALPRQRDHTSTVMVVEDKRPGHFVIEPGTVPIVRDVLPSLERGAFGRWRPVKAAAASTVVHIPAQRAASSSSKVDWSLRSADLPV